MRRAAIVLLLLSAGSAGLLAQSPAMINAIGMELVLIQPGSMIVGRFEPPYPTPPDPTAPPAANAAAGRGGRAGGAGRGGTPLTVEQYARLETMAKAAVRPGFTVRITRPYYIGKYEVTQAQWRAVMGTNPSMLQGDKVTDNADRHPVDNVTWEDAQMFITRLNTIEKTTAYRLPTEFEWEYAARAGEDADTPWSLIRERAIAGYNAFFTHQEVGTKKPNPWGLYDTLGNVWEWVQDSYNEGLFADPTPPTSGTVHVLKGGGFAADVKNAIPATHAAGPGSGFDVGFRIVRDVP
jgi:formylglycine-generating enzyme required for sulfatase activity